MEDRQDYETKIVEEKEKKEKMDKEFIEMKNEYYKYLNAFEGYRLMDKEFDNVFFNKLKI